MPKIKERILNLTLPKNRSAFLWGPRKTGKSYWLKTHFPKTPLIDLLQTDTFAEFVVRPSLLRERLSSYRGLVIIDEIQKIPTLLDEVHWLIENSSVNFILTGSSARKLKRGQSNLLGGRAWRRIMTPLSFVEVEGFDLEKVMISGLLPPHFLSDQPLEDLRAYLADYLKEEIAAEALVQNLPAFHEFLRIASITSSELLNYKNVASEVGVKVKDVRSYFDILEDTFLGFRIQPWTRSHERRMILTEKFYLFDVGVTNYLAHRQPKIGSTEFGKAFEHYILMELKSYQAYKNPELDIKFWRTSNGHEVDFILGEKDVALEIKAKSRVLDKDLNPIHTLLEDGPVKKKICVCLETSPRQVKNVEILPWQFFLQKLWAGEII